MFTLLFKSLRHPQFLLNSTLLPKKSIRHIVLLLTVIVSLPSLVSSIQSVSSFHRDIDIINNHLPEFSTADGILTSHTHPKSSALQTETGYVLYDIENNVPTETIEKLLNENYFNVIITKTDLSIYALTTPIHAVNFATTPITQNYLKLLLTQISASIGIGYVVAIISVFLSTLITVLVQNIFFALSSHLFFLVLNKRVRFDHLWRASLFASVLPYTIVTIFELFQYVLPFHTTIILIAILLAHYLALKDVFPQNH